MLRNRKAAEGSARKRLGRGLESLISKPVPIEIGEKSTPTTAPASKPTTETASPATGAPVPRQAAPERADASVVSIPVANIVPNRRQPRQTMDDPALAALADSIRHAGLMQPIVVRPIKSGAAGVASYELIAGERRWRAAQRIGLAVIPAIVRDVDDRSAGELALIENIQREDLNPVDRAEAFERLIAEFKLTHQDLAERLGLDRSTITNFTRLNTLDDYTKEMVRTGRLSLGHAKVLLAIANDKVRSDMAAKVVRDGWSVRELERRVQELREGGNVAAPEIQAARKAPPHLADLERRLGEHLGSKVRIRTGRKKGTGSLTIEFYTLEQFDGLMDRLGFVASDAISE